MSRLLRLMTTRSVVMTAIKVSLVVGTCLNAINQGNALWMGAGIAWGKITLNYVTPYLVASYSAAKARKNMGG